MERVVVNALGDMTAASPPDIPAFGDYMSSSSGICLAPTALFSHTSFWLGQPRKADARIDGLLALPRLKMNAAPLALNTYVFREDDPPPVD